MKSISSASAMVFAPGRRQHDGLDALHVAITQTHVNWILDRTCLAAYDT
jgi:hypothetical protein